MSYKGCFEFLKVPSSPEKPRELYQNIISDRGTSLGFFRDFLEGSQDIIDYVKFTDHAGLLSRFSQEFIQAKLEICKKLKIGTFPGGIPFEVAVSQGKAELYLEKLAELGFTGVEISEDVISPPLAPEKRKALIQRGKDAGLAVFTELGKKFPDNPLDVDEAIESARRDLENGARKVTIENSDLILMKKTNPGGMKKLAESVGLKHLIFEAGPNEFPQLALWLFKTVSREINLENIAFADLIPLEAMRFGLHRSEGYTFLRG